MEINRAYYLHAYGLEEEIMKLQKWIQTWVKYHGESVPHDDLDDFNGNGEDVFCEPYLCIIDIRKKNIDHNFFQKASREFPNIKLYVGFGIDYEMKDYFTYYGGSLESNQKSERHYEINY